MTYYIKGGSRYNAANPKVWSCLFLGGFPYADYLLTDWINLDDKNHETTADPFWRMGGSSGGAQELEIGLWDDYRIRFKTTGIDYYDGSWKDLLTGAGGGKDNLYELDDVVITGTPAEDEVLAWDTGTSRWINQTGGEAGLSLSGHGHGQLHDESHSLSSHSSEAHNELTGYNDETDVKHLTDAQLGALHTIYSLENHASSFHTDSYEPANANIQSHVSSPVTDAHHTLYTLESHNNTYHSTNYHTESDGTGAVTIHSGITDAGSGIIISTGERTALHPKNHDNTEHTTNYHTESDGTGAVTIHTGITDAGSGIIISTGERNALHTIYSLEQHDNDHHNPDFCVDDDGRLSDARTPIQHNNTYHSTNYHSEADGTGVATVHSDITSIGSGAIITTGERNALHAKYTDTEAIEALNYFFDTESTPTTPEWLYVCSLPTSSSGTYDHVYIEILGQDWTSDPVRAVYMFRNRTPFSYEWYYEGDAWSVNRPLIVVYEVGDRKDVYVKNNESYIAFQIRAVIRAGNINKSDDVNKTMILGKEQIPNSWVTSEPTGSLVFDASNLATYPPNMSKRMGDLTIEGNITVTGTVDGVDVSKLVEQSSTFPGAPSEGDFHYDEDDDSLYRYNAEALAWVEVGVGGGISGFQDNLGNHIATQTLNMATHKIEGVVDPVSDQDAATKIYVDNRVPYEASDDLVFSNDSEKNNSQGSWWKIKEISCYIAGNIRLYWEHKREAIAYDGETKVYVNDVAVSTARTATDSYTSETFDLAIENGDVLAIWGWALKALPPNETYIYARNMRIKYTDDFVIIS